MITNKIIIGSAQFGMNYGIANVNGQVKENDVQEILSFAKSRQINTIDTAYVYGESETILGRHANTHFRVITKIPALKNSADNVRNQFLSSLNRMNRIDCYGLLVHHADDLLGVHGDALYSSLHQLKQDKLVNKIGLSIYSPEQADKLVSRYEFDIIQFPLNILDQRFLQNDFLSRMKARNIELQARSIFLQGLLLMEHEKIPDYFNNIKPLLRMLNKECSDNNVTLRETLINFVLAIPEIDHLVFGIDDCNQLKDIAEDFLRKTTLPRIQAGKYMCDDLNMINASNWKIV